jgi:hypothetical protein
VKAVIRTAALLALLLTIGIVGLTAALAGAGHGAEGTVASDIGYTGNGFTWGDPAS